ncbi:hypothetical protein WISP_33443 [Willisornis vidua]|uniref:Uncharacterized protein n=1 Tax=Willisornis vidua TaxID=1566151 RepID=A0ABQ9DJE5_9PASS|nr:hypothetical protein WISP_33443 [Willisornis vidua]
MEKIILGDTEKYLGANAVIGYSQHSSRRGRSFLSNLTAFYDKETHLVVQGKPIDGILLDFSKAFLVVPPRILLDKLSIPQLGRHTQWWLVSEHPSARGIVVTLFAAQNSSVSNSRGQEGCLILTQVVASPGSLICPVSVGIHPFKASRVAIYGTGVVIYGTGVAIYGTGVVIYGTGVAICGTGVVIYGTGVVIYRTGVAIYGTGVVPQTNQAPAEGFFNIRLDGALSSLAQGKVSLPMARVGMRSPFQPNHSGVLSLLFPAAVLVPPSHHCQLLQLPLFLQKTLQEAKQSSTISRKKELSHPMFCVLPSPGSHEELQKLPYPVFCVLLSPEIHKELQELPHPRPCVPSNPRSHEELQELLHPMSCIPSNPGSFRSCHIPCPVSSPTLRAMRTFRNSESL